MDIGEAGTLDVGHGIADKGTVPRLGLECVYGLDDQVRAGLEEGGVVVGPRDDKADPVV